MASTSSAGSMSVFFCAIRTIQRTLHFKMGLPESVSWKLGLVDTLGRHPHGQLECPFWGGRRESVWIIQQGCMRLLWMVAPPPVVNSVVDLSLVSHSSRLLRWSGLGAVLLRGYVHRDHTVQPTPPQPLDNGAQQLERACRSPDQHDFLQQRHPCPV
jgi:hypothetical protein